jgi:Protein of unknown function (DUF2818).
LRSHLSLRICPFCSSAYSSSSAAGGRKGFGWRLLELVVLYLIVGTVALVLEARAHGGSYPQGWQFYATTFCLFVVFAFPGFVYRHLLRRRSDVVRVA